MLMDSTSVSLLAHETDLPQLHLQLLVLPGQLYPKGCLHTPHQGLRWEGETEEERGRGGEGGEGGDEGREYRLSSATL